MNVSVLLLLSSYFRMEISMFSVMCCENLVCIDICLNENF